MVLFRRSPWPVQVFAGLLASLNPFVYGRLVEGQWGVAAALGMTFLWLGAWERLQRRRRWTAAALCALLALAAMAFDQHAIGLLALLAVVSLLWHRAWRDRVRLGWSIASFLPLGPLLLFGLVPFFLSHGTDSYFAVERFSKADLLEFRAAASRTYGLWANLAGMFGFWPERLGRIPLLNNGAPWWPLPAGVLVAAAAAGAWFRRDRVWLLVSGLAGLAIAGSTATGPGLDAMQWLFQRIPLLAAYREPEKWSALWVLAVVVLGAEGLGALLAKAASARPTASAVAGLAAACIGLSVLVPNGVAALGELPATIVPVEFPGSWIGAAAFLQERAPASQPVVVLPWLLYEPLPFTGDRLVSNPAPVVFPGRLLSSNDAQITGAANETGPDNLAGAALHPQPGSCELSSKLRRLGVEWAIVEPAPGGRADAGALLSCGFRVRYGHLSGVELLSR
jgi:chromate transport protein ChrA